MRFVYGKQDMRSLERAQETTFLLTNGLGGYSSVMAGFGVPRCDQGILVAAEKAPNVRINLVHRVSEKLYTGNSMYFLSAQTFADTTPYEDGYRWQRKFAIDYTPVWNYEVDGVQVERHLCMEHGKNTAALVYRIENNNYQPCTLVLRPYFKFAPKENAIRQRKRLLYAGGVVVETMFVDEGFGSLDKDSLEQAVAILKELATDNRIVGIISHVEELKECIDKKILLTKSAQGSSISWDE